MVTYKSMNGAISQCLSHPLFLGYATSVRGRIAMCYALWLYIAHGTNYDWFWWWIFLKATSNCSCTSALLVESAWSIARVCWCYYHGSFGLQGRGCFKSGAGIITRTAAERVGNKTCLSGPYGLHDKDKETIEDVDRGCLDEKRNNDRDIFLTEV